MRYQSIHVSLTFFFLYCFHLLHFFWQKTSKLHVLQETSVHKYIHKLLYHSHKKRKDSLETRAILLIISLEHEISEVAVPSIHQKSEKLRLLWGIALWKWLWGCFSYFLLLWPWCQGLWAVQKIATDQKEYRKCKYIHNPKYTYQSIP